MALAATASHAPAIPVTLVRRSGVLVTVVAALGFRFGAQRSVLPFGLKAGRHPVRVATNTWAPGDTGRHPVVIFAAGGPAALEQPFPAYLASHGYTVVRAPGANAETVARQFDDSTAVAIISWGRDSGAAVSVALPGGAVAPLSVRLLRRGVPQAGHLRIVLPAGNRPGAESRSLRMLCAVTQAILNAALEGARPTWSELAGRLKAAGVREAYIRVS